MKPILEVNQVHKAFGSTNILNGISFRMEEGERICLLGPSGCGKSTLLQLVAGLLPTDDGEIIMDGVKVSGRGSSVAPESRPVNMVFQDYALWPHMSVRENIAYGMKRRKVAAAEREARLASLAKLLQLEGLLSRVPAELSGGQQQRVGIARALATEPRILLMDEPLSNLDVKLRAEMRNELAAMLSELSITTLYVTHDLMEAFALADRILVLHGGAIEQIAAPRDMYEAPATPWVAELMGYHNRLTGTVVALEGDEAVIQCGDQKIRGMLSADPGCQPALDSQAAVMLHMESLRLAAVEEDAAVDISAANAGNLLCVIVRRAIYEGERWRCLLATRDGQLLEGFLSEAPELGSEVAVVMPCHRTRVYALEPSRQLAGAAT